MAAALVAALRDAAMQDGYLRYTLWFLRELLALPRVSVFVGSDYP